MPTLNADTVTAVGTAVSALALLVLVGCWCVARAQARDRARDIARTIAVSEETVALARDSSPDDDPCGAAPHDPEPEPGAEPDPSPIVPLRQTRQALGYADSRIGAMEVEDEAQAPRRRAVEAAGGTVLIGTRAVHRSCADARRDGRPHQICVWCFPLLSGRAGPGGGGPRG